jgi:hypothetical protein
LEGRGRRIRIFFGPRIYFYRKGRRFQKSSLLEVWRKGGREENIFFSNQGFFYRERGKELFGTQKRRRTQKRKKE